MPLSQGHFDLLRVISILGIITQAEVKIIMKKDRPWKIISAVLMFAISIGGSHVIKSYL